MGNIENIEYIYNIENLFFPRREDVKLDYEKLFVDSFLYDSDYERGVRNKAINSLYVLDELLITLLDKDFNIVNILGEIEDDILEHHLMYKVFSNVELLNIKSNLERVCANIRKGISFLNKDMSENSYLLLVSDFSNLDISRTKTEFIKEVEQIVSFIEDTLV